MGSLKSVCFTEAERSVDAQQGINSNGKLVWVMGADFEDARMAIDSYIVPWLEQLGIYDYGRSSLPTHKDQQAVVNTKTGNTYKAISAYDPLKIGREQPDRIQGEEISRWEKEVWDRSFGRLARKYETAQGFFSGSFESSLGWFPEIWKQGQSPNLQDIVSYSLPSWANIAIYPGGRDDPAIISLENQSPTPERFLERYGGKPAQPTDAVLPEFRVMLHVETLELDPSKPVYVFIDPGDYVYCVLFVQFVDDEVRVLNEVYVHNYSHEQVVQAVQLAPEWKYVRGGVMDVAGKQQSAGGFGSPVDHWRKDTGLSLKTNYMKVEQTIERLRSVLAINPATMKPRLRIDPKCRGLISEGGGGPSPVRGGGLWRMRGMTPRAENDHAWKSLAYGIRAIYGTTRPDDEDYEDDEAGDSSYVSSYMSRPRARVEMSSLNSKEYL